MLLLQLKNKTAGMKKKLSFKSIWQVLKKSFSGFSEDKVPKLSASLAYYTVFSLGPLLIVIIFLGSIFYEGMEDTIYQQMQGFVGSDAAAQIEDIIRNASLSGKSTMAATIGVITLLIGATTVFGEIQDSINTIWGLKPKPKAGMLKLVMDRLLSFGIIASLGFLLLVSLAVTTVVESLNDRLKDIFPDVTVGIFYVLNLVITLAVVTVLFAVIFKVLPDARIKWRDVWAGAFATAVLFLIGKMLIALYVSKSDIGSTYGAAGSLVVLLVWIYYSAFILYFGAEFTKAYALHFGGEIHPSKFAVVAKKVEVEGGKQSVQEMESKTNDLKSQSKDVDTMPQKVAAVQQTHAPRPPQPTPPAAYSYEAPAPKGIKAGKKPVGFGTLVGGLLLYFISSKREEK